MQSEKRKEAMEGPGMWAVAATAILLAVLLALASAGPAHGATKVAGFEAETMRLPSGTGQVFGAPRASGGKALLIWSNATALREVSTPASDRIIVRVKGDQCEGSPQMTVKVDGRKVIQKWVWQTGWTDYAADVSLDDGGHMVEVAFGHDYGTSDCDRNLRVDEVSFLGNAAPGPQPEDESSLSTGSSPFAGAEFFVDPNSVAKRQAEEWRYSRPADAEQIDKIANQPMAAWFVGSEEVRGTVDRYVTAASTEGALPVLVAYNIPIRDCGSYSGGGASSASEYESWIRSFAAGIGGRRAAVILEPDALALMDCLSSEQKQERYALIKDAVNVLSSQGASVYIDAGHSNWHGTDEMASRLSLAGVESARGFSLNVSNFERTGDATAFGNAVSSKIGGKPYVVDTGRNGNGSNGEWCNPSGRALGERPTAATGVDAADAYLWIKPPGESDGTCNGGPPAGSWWAGYALGLAERAAY